MGFASDKKVGFVSDQPSAAFDRSTFGGRESLYDLYSSGDYVWPEERSTEEEESAQVFI